MDFYHSPVAVWVNSAPQPKRWGPRAHRGIENPRSRSWVMWTLKVTTWVQYSLNSHSFVPCQSTLPFLIIFFPNLTLKIQGEDEMTIMLHNYRSWQFHITMNGINPSNGFRDMAFTKSGPSAASFVKFWAMGKPIWGKLLWQCTTTSLEKPMKL